MASLLPLIQDLLPMILPTQIHITRGRDLAPNPAPPSQAPPEPRLDLGVLPGTSEDGVVAASERDGVDASGRDGADATDSSAATAASTAGAANADATAPAAGHGTPLTAAATGGVLRRDAIVNKSDRMCASVLFAGPRSSSAIHHNSEHDSIIYAASGKGTLATSPPDDDAPPKHVELEPGDFAFVPAWTEHQLVNDTDEQVVWVVIQGGPSPIVVDLTEWGGPEAKPARPAR